MVSTTWREKCERIFKKFFQALTYKNKENNNRDGPRNVYYICQK